MIDPASPTQLSLWFTSFSGGVLGAIGGSFVANLTARWPAGRSVLRGRSVCEGCGAALRPHELVPLFSFAVQHGRCRRCGIAIGGRYPLIEASAAVIGAGAGLAALPLGWVGLIFGLALLALAVLDAEHFWLPDALTLPLVGLGLAAAAAGLGPAIRDSAIGAGAGFVALSAIAVAYRWLRGREGLGGGDPKLLAAIGAWLGWQALPIVLLLASGTGLLLVLVDRVCGDAVRADMRVPLGALLALAAWPVWLWFAAQR